MLGYVCVFQGVHCVSAPAFRSGNSKANVKAAPRFLCRTRPLLGPTWPCSDLACCLLPISTAPPLHCWGALASGGGLKGLRWVGIARGSCPQSHKLYVCGVLAHACACFYRLNPCSYHVCLWLLSPHKSLSLIRVAFGGGRVSAEGQPDQLWPGGQGLPLLHGEIAAPK